MAALQDYARLGVFMDGDALTQLTSVNATWNSGNQRVDLLNEGLGGFTPGSGDVTIEIGFAVPIGGTEDEFLEKLTDRAFVTMQLGIGRKSYSGRGKIETASISQSVSGSVEGSFTWTGELRKPE